MRIALVTPGPANDRGANSGIPYYMAQALRRCAEIIPIPTPASVLRPLAFYAARAHRRIRRTGYLPEFSVPVAVEQSLQIERQLRRARPNVVFAPFASGQLVALHQRVPIFYSSDTTFRLMRDYYPSFTGLSSLSHWEGETLERRAVQRAAGLIYPSTWAAQSAIHDYGASPDRVLVAPYGANLDEAPDRARALTAERGPSCSLAFVAVNWVRKGGAVAVAVAAALRARGIPAHLTVVGCEPPGGVDRTDMTVVPRIDKSDPSQRRALTELYLQSYFLLLPTQADCSPIVCCEASAHGTPVLIANTGGVAGHVRDDVNGYLLPPGGDPGGYVEVIASLWRERDRYHRLVASTRRQFEERLNWDAWAQSALQHITLTCAGLAEK